MSLFDAHRDIRKRQVSRGKCDVVNRYATAFVSTDISYGLFLSDHQILDLPESELVILPAIMCQNLRGPTSWHLRGCVRAGITRPEVEQIQQVIERIAAYAGRKLDNIERVADVED